MLLGVGAIAAGALEPEVVQSPTEKLQEARALAACFAAIDYFNGERADGVGMPQAISEMTRDPSYIACPDTGDRVVRVAQADQLYQDAFLSLRDRYHIPDYILFNESP